MADHSAKAALQLQRIDDLLTKCSQSDPIDPEYCVNCISEIQKALDLAQLHKLPEKQLKILHRLTLCCMALKDHEAALSHIQSFFTLLEQGYPFPLKYRIYSCLARLNWFKGDYDSAYTNNLKAAEYSKEQNDIFEYAGACMNLSALLRMQGKIDASIEYINEAITCFTQLGRQDMILLAKGNLANILFSQGQLDQALELKLESIDYFASVNNVKQLAIDYSSISIIYHKMNRLEQAIAYSLKSLTIKEELNDTLTIAPNWLNLGVFYNDYGDNNRATTYYLKALEAYQNTGDKNGVSQILNNLGNMNLARKEYAVALDYFLQSLSIKQENNDIPGIAHVLMNIGIIHFSHFKDFAKGLELTEQAWRYALQIKDTFLQATLELHLTEIKVLQAKYPEALKQIKQTGKFILTNGFEKLYAQLHQLYADIYTATKDYKNACVALKNLCQVNDHNNKADTIARIAEMQAKYDSDKKEKEAEIYRLKNIDLETKNREIEAKQAMLQETLDKLQNSEIRYNFVTEELTKNIKTTLIGKSEAIHNISEMITLVARADKTNVLITGETGTGKEIVARNIHACSKRAKSHFYAVNCSAVTETLFESQFFGHEKDAFTGATSTKIGWFEIADKSTLFLDEICSLSFEQQAKLLRVLEERTIVRVGSHREIPIDVRIISAANCNLLDKVNAGLFRRDLYHRLAIFVINIPPLRDRLSEIPLLLNHFVGLTSVAMNKVINKIEKNIAVQLMEYDFPGNVRELKNMVERAVLIANSSTLRLEHFMIPLHDEQSVSVSGFSEEGNPFFQMEGNLQSDLSPLDELERQLLVKTLKMTGFNRVQAAKLLKVDRKVIERKIKKYGIEN